MKSAVCFFLLFLLVGALFLAPVFLRVEEGDAFCLTVAACPYHAHGSVRLTLPHPLWEGLRTVGDAGRALIPPFLREPLSLPLGAAMELYALFVEVLRSELVGCEGALPLS